jgi:predicted O-methyltransferase YrrM
MCAGSHPGHKRPNSLPPVTAPAITIPWWTQFPARAAASALRWVPRIPATQLEQVFPGIDRVEVTMKHHVGDRALSHGEALVLALITAFIQPRHILEIGTASGQGTTIMAEQAPQARIDTLDLGNDAPSLGQQRGQPPWQDLSAIGSVYRDAGHAERVTQHLSDSARFDYGSLGGQVDLAFIDGAHTYEYVASDSRQVLAQLAPGGVVVWDDCDYRSPGVSRALVGLRAEGRAIYRLVGTRLAVLRG